MTSPLRTNLHAAVALIVLLSPLTSAQDQAYRLPDVHFLKG